MNQNEIERDWDERQYEKRREDERQYELAIEEERYRTAQVNHPGILLKREMEARHWNQTYLAELLDINPSYLSDILRGRRRLSLSVAMRLEKVIGASAEMWLKMQVEYDLYLARKELENV